MLYIYISGVTKQSAEATTITVSGQFTDGATQNNMPMMHGGFSFSAPAAEQSSWAEKIGKKTEISELTFA